MSGLYEYKVISIRETQDFEDRLNELGRDGWRLVQFYMEPPKVRELQYPVEEHIPGIYVGVLERGIQ